MGACPDSFPLVQRALTVHRSEIFPLSAMTTQSDDENDENTPRVTGMAALMRKAEAELANDGRGGDQPRPALLSLNV